MDLPREDFTLAYTYKRSLGPILGAFFTALGEGRLLGARTASGRVIVPPCEADPETGRDIAGLVEVGPQGTVLSWTWVSEPLDRHPLDRPFAWALIQPDGADTAWVQVLDSGDPDRVSVGLRVQPRVTTPPTGSVRDWVYEPS